MDFLTIAIVVALIVLSGLFSGLTLGLMSLRKYELKRKAKLGNVYAQKIYPLRKNGNLLLCTLLLGNVGVNATLSIFLGSLTSGVVALVVATLLIVTLGEILPQAIFSRYALYYGARFTWLVYIFLVLLYPLTKPLAYLLDTFLGRELQTAYSKKEFRAIVREQKKLGKRQGGSGIDQDEFEILEGGLEYSTKMVGDVMTPLKNTFYVQEMDMLNPAVLRLIHKRGHSRIPVLRKKKVVGILYTKDLITIDPEDALSVKKLMRKVIVPIQVTEKLDDVLELFKKKKKHLFVVLDDKKNVVGIITLEDVLEEIVGEIIDEYDYVEDMRRLRGEVKH